MSISRPPATVTAPPPTSSESLRLRASMLSHFEVPWLGELGDQADKVDRLLLEDCSRITGPDGLRHWAVDDAVRRAVVSGVSQDEMRLALRAATTVPQDARQWAINTLVCESGLPDLDQLGLEQIRALEAVSRWLDSDAQGATQTMIRNRLALSELLASLRMVASSHFVGRRSELFTIATGLFVGGPPVFIRGFGGIGKSALLASYLIGAVEEHSALFAYLNFDDAALDPGRPASIVRVIARQLSMQLDPAGSARAERVAERARDRERTAHQSSSVQTRTLQTPSRELVDLLFELAGLLTPGRPLILAFDTVEEIQRRDKSAIYALVDLLVDIRQAMPLAQLVLAGRAPVPELRVLMPQLPATELELTGLPEHEAIELLSVLYDRGDLDLKLVISQVGTSPLCIRLAAGILAHAPPDEALRDIELGRVGVEGELYRRLLGHIADRDVRRLAHPGLTLRRITPELIEVVLAGPCGVEIATPGRAIELFEGLAREAMLVEPDPTDQFTLIHRPDVRRMMLARLSSDEPEVVAQIHAGAVSHYSGRPDLVSQTEAMYHRLMLGEPELTLDTYWHDALANGLVGSIEELPPVSRAYLAARVPKLGISEADLREAELETRRTLVTRQVQERVGVGRATEAAAVLDSHVQETGDQSPQIADLRIQVLELTGQLVEAAQLAAQVRDTAAHHGAVDDFVTFTLHLARLTELTGNPAAAASQLSDVAEFIRSLEQTEKHKLLQLQLIVAQLGVQRRSGLPVDERAADDAVRLYGEIGLQPIRQVPGLLRDLAGEVGTRSQEILQVALRTVGVAPEEAKRIDEAVETPSPALSPDIERGEAGTSISELLDEVSEDESAGIGGTVAGIYTSESDSAAGYPADEAEPAEPAD